MNGDDYGLRSEDEVERDQEDIEETMPDQFNHEEMNMGMSSQPSLPWTATSWPWTPGRMMQQIMQATFASMAAQSPAFMFPPPPVAAEVSPSSQVSPATPPVHLSPAAQVTPATPSARVSFTPSAQVSLTPSNQASPVTPSTSVAPVAPSTSVSPVAPSSSVPPVAPSTSVPPVSPSTTVSSAASSENQTPASSAARSSAVPENVEMSLLARAIGRIDETLNKVLEALHSTSGRNGSSSQPQPSTSRGESGIAPRPRPSYTWDNDDDELSDGFEPSTSKPKPAAKKLPAFKRGPGRPKKVPAPKKKKPDAESAEAAQPDITCTICYARPSTCKLDSCPHCYCEQCILTMVQADAPLQKCPKCRKYFDNWEVLFW